MRLKITGSGIALIVGLVLSTMTAFAQAPATPATGGPMPSAQGAAVYFINIRDGQKLPRKFTVQFGLRNMGLAAAGADRENSGHHHLLIDTDLPKLDEPIPSDFNHLHFGAGQSEEEITLPAGEHTLQLLFGDKNHVPHSTPVMSEKIKITVVDTLPAASASAPVGATPAAAVAPTATKPAAVEPSKSSKQEQQELRKQQQQQRALQRQQQRAQQAIAVPKKLGKVNWCARKFGSDFCGFTSFEQCMASVSGESGFCIQK
jgi:hypothetical protein